MRQLRSASVTKAKATSFKKSASEAEPRVTTPVKPVSKEKESETALLKVMPPLGSAKKSHLQQPSSKKKPKIGSKVVQNSTEKIERRKKSISKSGESIEQNSAKDVRVVTISPI